MSSYTHEDGTPDTAEDVLNSARCFAVALGHVFKEKEGLVVELAYQEKYPNDAHGKFIVYRKNGAVRISVCDEEDQHLAAGSWLWVHDTQEEAAAAQAADETNALDPTN